MAYDEALAERVRDILAPRDDVVEKKMFGGLCFMVRGHMTCGLTTTDLMIRVGKEAWGDALAQPNAREMDFTGRSLKGFVYVDPDGVEDDSALNAWVRHALAYNATLKPK